MADVRGRDVQPVHEESRQTRLGRAFTKRTGSSRKPSPAPPRPSGNLPRSRAKNPPSIRVIATSAARDAVNPDDLISAIEAASGLKVEIISGEQEAEWAFQGVTTDPELARQPLLLLDVGGGSTEFILGPGRTKHFAHSFPLGTVRLLEKFPHSDPPTRGEFTACRDWLKNFLRDEVRPQLEPALKNEAGEIQLVGTGGTTSILARIERSWTASTAKKSSAPP